jgi:hypothetical protein
MGVFLGSSKIWYLSGSKGNRSSSAVQGLAKGCNFSTHHKKRFDYSFFACFVYEPHFPSVHTILIKKLSERWRSFLLLYCATYLCKIKLGMSRKNLANLSIPPERLPAMQSKKNFGRQKKYLTKQLSNSMKQHTYKYLHIDM